MYSNLNSLSKLISNVKKNTRLSNADMQDVIARVQTNYTLDDFVTENQTVKEMLYEIKAAALTPYPILLVGETGTGKEILASAIHSENLQMDFTPYVKINCSAIPYDLLESELFGYEKGAFTGANSSKKGKFEVAAGGSILLDEIGDMDTKLQGKLLRVLEEKEFERLGSVKVIPLQARIIASTNCDLKKLRLQGKFRDDLYYRLNTVEIKIPPLRDRRDDIPLLVSHFLEEGNIPLAISAEAMSAMMHYNWPGNVRELRNTINRLGITRAGKSVTVSDVKNLFSKDAYEPIEGDAGSSESNSYFSTSSFDEHERQLILKVLKLEKFNIAGAARHLGSTRATLYRKIKKYGITLKKTAI